MNDYALLIDLHKRGERQAPGGKAETELAVALAGLDRTAPLEVADIGCGTGASALLLARLLNARVAAVDLFPEFLAVLEQRATAQAVDDRISLVACSMDNLPFQNETLDVVWSEGAIYNIGFEKGVAAWRRYLKPGGVLVVSEITWLTDSRPTELQEHWDGEYREIDVASAKIRAVERQGYSPLGYFTLPERCWMEEYYRPLQGRFSAFLARHGNSEDARKIVAAERQEMSLYERYSRFVGYGMYIAKKIS